MRTRLHLLLLASTLSACRGGPSWLPGGVRVRKHAVVIVVDTLRGESMLQAKTPRLDEFAREGDEVERAWAAGTWTAPSVVSMFTGTQVREHGWDFPFPSYMDDRNDSYPPVPDRPVLAEVMREAGFETAGYYGNPLLRHDLGYARGFDVWRFSRDRAVARRVAQEVASWAPDERHFLYVHLFGAHQPLRPSAEARERWGVDPSWIKPGRGFRAAAAREGGEAGTEQYRRAYYAVVEDLDERIGAILHALEPVREEALVVITSDHGEMLGEHGRIGHNHWVWEPLAQVPLFAQGAVDLPRTMSMAALPDLVCRSVGVDHDWAVGIDDDLLVSQREGKLALSADGRRKGLWDEDLAGGFAVFDLRDDPLEEVPLADDGGTLQALRQNWEARVPHTVFEARAGGMEQDLRDALGELGYLDEE